MSNATLFQVANTFVLVGWILLIFAPRWRWTSRLSIGLVVAPLALLYVVLVFSALQPGDFESFSSLEGIMALFGNEKAVLVGWIHYLAFDLLAGWFVVADAQRSGVPHWLVVPCLLLCFMLGPTGLLLYLLIRLLMKRSYFVDFPAPLRE